MTSPNAPLSTPNPPDRNHPVAVALAGCAAAQPPSRAELDALIEEVCGGMDDEQISAWRDAFVKACQEATALREGGENGPARESAAANAAKLIALLVDEWAPKDDTLGPDGKPDPKKVLDRIPRS